MIARGLVIADHHCGTPFVRRAAQVAQEECGTELAKENEEARGADKITDELAADVFELQREDPGYRNQSPGQPPAHPDAGKESHAFPANGPVEIRECAPG